LESRVSSLETELSKFSVQFFGVENQLYIIQGMLRQLTRKNVNALSCN